jgi:hypothetical protein
MKLRPDTRDTCTERSRLVSKLHSDMSAGHKRGNRADEKEGFRLVRGGAREMVEFRCTGILQLSCSSRESGQPSKFSVTGDPARDARATATRPEESDGRGQDSYPSRPLAPPT